MSEKFLLNWAEEYFKSRDAFHKKIVSIEKQDNKLIINYKEEKEVIFPAVDMDNLDLNALSGKCAIIAINSKKILILYTKNGVFFPKILS